MALPTIEQVLASPATHNWLKSALASALDKDPVDASYDAELLAKLLRARLDSMLGTPVEQLVSRAYREPVPEGGIEGPRLQRRVPFTRNVYSRREHRSA